VNKKKQKNFLTLGRAGFVATGPSDAKYFAPLLIEKATIFRPVQLPIGVSPVLYSNSEFG
jgi:hypothetical protein